MPTPADVRLATLYTRRYNQLRAAAATAMARAWDRQAGLDDSAAARFTTTAATIAVAAQTQAAAAVDGYMATMLGFVTGEGTALGIDPEAVTGAAVRAGAEPVDVYLRSIVTARLAVSGGHPFAEAMKLGRLRALATVETDVALAQRAATTEVLSAQPRIVGYRRVLTGTSCARCGTASTQRYYSGNLMPIHAHCDCGVAPIIGTSDPGKVINKPLVENLKNAGNATGDPDYWRSRKLTVDEDGTVHLPDVAVHQHGELGPVLTDANHKFSGPGDIAA